MKNHATPIHLLDEATVSGTIIVVDDTKENLHLLKSLLDSIGIKVRPSTSGKLAIDSALLDPPDLILLDIRMPDMDGFEVCRRLKAEPRTCDIPVIFISAYNELENRIQGFKLGAVDYITKPFEQDEVIQRVRTHLELNKMRCSLKQMVDEKTLQLRAMVQQLDATVQALKTLSEVNQALVRSENEADLLKSICQAVHKTGGFPLVWIGLVDEQSQKLAQVAHMGGSIWQEALIADLVDQLVVGANHGPTKVALTTGVHQQCHDMTACTDFSHLTSQMSQLGLCSVIALPLKLKHKDTAFGVITLFSEQPGAITDDALKLLQELADDLAFGISHLRNLVTHRKIEQERIAQVERTNQALAQTIQAMVKTTEKRDPYTAGHQSRVAELALAIGQELGLSKHILEGLSMSAMIHDLGKIYVPSEILNRPGRLSHAEFEIIRDHPQVGHDIIKGIDLPWPVAKVILQHHERFDGSGYPQGLHGQQILLEARIIAVADALEAMSNHRPYRSAVGLSTALQELENKSGSHFDPEVVAACLRLFREKHYQLPTHMNNQVNHDPEPSGTKNCSTSEIISCDMNNLAQKGLRMNLKQAVYAHTT